MSFLGNFSVIFKPYLYCVSLVLYSLSQIAPLRIGYVLSL